MKSPVGLEGYAFRKAQPGDRCLVCRNGFVKGGSKLQGPTRRSVWHVGCFRRRQDQGTRLRRAPGSFESNSR